MILFFKILFSRRLYDLARVRAQRNVAVAGALTHVSANSFRFATSVPKFTPFSCFAARRVAKREYPQFFFPFQDAFSLPTRVSPVDASLVAQASERDERFGHRRPPVKYVYIEIKKKCVNSISALRDKMSNLIVETDEVSLSDEIDARDYGRVVQIERQNYSDDFKFWEDGIGIEEKWSFDDDDFVWFVERESGTVVAYALLDVERPEFLYLNDLGVSPDHAGRGHAKNILRRLVEWSANDERKVVLKVAADNARARTLYQKFGFIETQFPYMTLPEDHVFMHLTHS